MSEAQQTGTQTASLAGGRSQNTGELTAEQKGVKDGVRRDIEAQQKYQQKLQAEKYAKASDASYTTGTFFNVRYAELDDAFTSNESHFITTKGGKSFRIICYIAPKFNLDNSKRFDINMQKSLAMRLILGNQIQGIVLQDRLDSIGLSGFVEVKSTDSYLDLFLERHNNFFFIINVQQKVQKNKTETEIISYQPYIFDVTWVEQISSPENNVKKMRIHLIDCVTAILKTHSIASVIRFNSGITEASSYKEVFRIILDYVKCYLKTNSNHTSDFRKDILYGSGVRLTGSKYNGYDNENNMSSLIKNTFGKIERNATILQALHQMLQDCVTTLKVPKQFSDGYESIGDLLIPFFFKEEYPDRYAVYPSFWVDQEVFGKVNKKKKTDAKPQATTDTDTSTTDTSTTDTSTTDTPTDTGQTTEGSPAQTPPENQQQTSAVMTIDQGTGSDSPDPAPGTGETGSVAQPIWLQEPAAVQSLAAQGQEASVSAAAAETNNEETEDENNTESIQQGIVQHFQQVFTQQTASGRKIKMRQITMRDFFMPFYLCFGASPMNRDTATAPSAVYEVFMPQGSQQDYKNLLSMNGYYSNKSIYNLQFDPIDMSTVRKIWKNVVFIDCSTQGSAGNSTLIFFNWFYDYFSQVFLNNNKRGYISNVIPDFYTISRNTGAGNALKSGDTFDCLFDEYNAYTYATQTDDTVNECLRHMGRNISSFVLLNDAYTFSVDGDIMRRPNEIIQLGMAKKNDGTTNILTAHTDLNFSQKLLLYVRQVTHKFVGTTYENVLNCCKICEYNPTALKTQLKV